VHGASTGYPLEALEDGEQILDILATHPATAHFMATKLVRRFVSDSMPPSLVERVAATFTRSDIRECLRTIFASPEFSRVPRRRVDQHRGNPRAH
jgi:uncharacterized protein (DUF1800 family)